MFRTRRARRDTGRRKVPVRDLFSVSETPGPGQYDPCPFLSIGCSPGPSRPVKSVSRCPPSQGSQFPKASVSISRSQVMPPSEVGGVSVSKAYSYRGVDMPGLDPGLYDPPPSRPSSRVSSRPDRGIVSWDRTGHKFKAYRPVPGPDFDTPVVMECVIADSHVHKEASQPTKTVAVVEEEASLIEKECVSLAENMGPTPHKLFALLNELKEKKAALRRRRRRQ
mmetsp:Transcript_41223/g.93227  ORF Transcript_41223/g.93227 Transcript_41223/m.93227 type:complete len:223 (+) Transcript_41223:44-712(+)